MESPVKLVLCPGRRTCGANVLHSNSGNGQCACFAKIDPNVAFTAQVEVTMRMLVIILTRLGCTFVLTIELDKDRN